MGRLLVEGDGVLVGGDVRAVEQLLHVAACDAHAHDVGQQQVVVGAAGDEADAALGERVGQGRGVAHDLVLILRELGLHGLPEADGLARDDVHERAALGAGEDGGVNLLGELLLAEDDGAAGAAQGLVRGRRDHVGIGHGRGMGPAGDQAADVGHVHEHIGPDLVAYLADPGPVYDAGVGGGAGDYHLRLQLPGHAAHLVIVDELGGGVHAVGAHVEVLAGDGRLGAVGEVAAAGEVHAHDDVAGLGEREVNGHVGLRAGVRLHVGVLRAEELLGPVAADVLDDIDVFAAAVEALSGIALGILVGEMAADGLHHCRRGEVLGGDKLDVVALPRQLLLHGGEDLCVFLA